MGEQKGPQYLSLVAACLLSLIVAGVAGFIGMVTGSAFAAKEPDAAAGWVGWAIAGLALGAPIAGLPRLGFRVRPAVVLPVAAVLAVTVAATGAWHTGLLT